MTMPLNDMKNINGACKKPRNAFLVKPIDKGRLRELCKLGLVNQSASFPFSRGNKHR